MINYFFSVAWYIAQAPDERNYHVFYEMLSGLGDAEKEKYGLQSADNYFYLNQVTYYLCNKFETIVIYYNCNGFGETFYCTDISVLPWIALVKYPDINPGFK